MIAVAALAAGLTNPATSTAIADEVNIYSYRQEALIKPQLEAFRNASSCGKTPLPARPILRSRRAPP